MVYATSSDIINWTDETPNCDLTPAAILVRESILTPIIATASKRIDVVTGRTYDDRGAIVRRYRIPKYLKRDVLLLDDDLHTFTSVTLDGETVDVDDIELLRFTRDEEFPYRGIRLYGGHWAGDVYVSGEWGWASVPPTVKQCCKQIAARLYKRPGSPVGFQASDVDIMKVPNFDGDIADMLRDYCLTKAA